MGYFRWVRHYFGWVGVRGVYRAKFWIGRSGWGIILGGWWWVGHYFGWVGGGALFWVGGCGWG